MLLLPLLACTSEPETDTAASAPDLTERLGPDAARAGKVMDPAALVGGISAEGAVGDFLLYNDRVKFVIQAPGDSSFYVEYGGGLIDADVVRDPGVPGRDIIDEMTPMVGLGRVVDANSVTVIADGSDGAAIVRVEGPAAPMRLVTGSLESPSVIPDLALRVRTDFALEPGSWALKATTTVWNEEDEAVVLDIGELGLLAFDAAEAWRPGTGRADPSDAPLDWVGAIAHRNEVALAVLPDAGQLQTGTIGRLLGSFAPAVTGFGETVTIEPGASTTWARWIGVAPDLATLTGEHLARIGAARKEVSGVVTADGAAVAGARVHVLDAGGSPLTVALADENGAWSATVPESAAGYVATGRGTGLWVDLPPGHGWLSPYEPDPETTLASIADGAPGAPMAEGYGIGAVGASTDIALTKPGQLVVDVTDGGPAVVRAYFLEGDPVAADERLVPGRPAGAAAVGFVRDGSLTMDLEPGTYDVVVHRGVRDELVRQSVSVASGEAAQLVADIVPAYTIEGVHLIDPHSHASPSGDGGIPMADRLLVTAANGVDVHVGTDHDHVADYRPLLAPMGLDGRLRSIVADEVSPVLRGHFNVWPAVRTNTVNGGAPQWWLGYADTAEIFGWMRELAVDGGIVQANHPVGDSGMFTIAGYDANGRVERADAWSSDFDAMELLNSGDWANNLPYYLDLVNRGKLVTPVGVSDSHGHTSGGVGLNVTFLHTGVAFEDLDDAAILEAMARRATVVSMGPFIDARVDGEWAPGAEVPGGSTLTVAVKAPSWMPVETVTLYENGTIVATEACEGVAPTPCETSFLLDPISDAAYVVLVASATRTMEGAHPGNLAWAATSAVRVDAGGDGWTAPLPPIVVGE